MIYCAYLNEADYLKFSERKDIKITSFIINYQDLYILGDYAFTTVSVRYSTGTSYESSNPEETSWNTSLDFILRLVHPMVFIFFH